MILPHPDLGTKSMTPTSTITLEDILASSVLPPLHTGYGINENSLWRLFP